MSPPIYIIITAHYHPRSSRLCIISPCCTFMVKITFIRHYFARQNQRNSDRRLLVNPVLSLACMGWSGLAATCCTFHARTLERRGGYSLQATKTAGPSGRMAVFDKALWELCFSSVCSMTCKRRCGLSLLLFISPAVYLLFYSGGHLI